MHEHFGDAFEETNLESVLAAREVGRLVVTGAQTDACIRSTLHGAFVRGYESHARRGRTHHLGPPPMGSLIAPEQAIAYTNVYWKWSAAPGRSGRTVATAEVDFAARCPRSSSSSSSAVGDAGAAVSATPLSRLRLELVDDELHRRSHHLPIAAICESALGKCR